MGSNARYKCPKCGTRLNYWSQEYIEKHLSRCAKRHPPIRLKSGSGRPSKKELRELDKKKKMVLEALEDQDE